MPFLFLLFILLLSMTTFTLDRSETAKHTFKMLPHSFQESLLPLDQDP